jgi:outer membrane protein TolC
VALGRYKEGLGTILDVLNAESQYTGALQSQLQSRYNLLATRVDLIRAVGIIDLETLRQQAALSPARDEPPATDQP